MFCALASSCDGVHAEAKERWRRAVAGGHGLNWTHAGKAAAAATHEAHETRESNVAAATRLIASTRITSARRPAV